MAPGNNERHPGHTGTIPKTKARNNCNVPQEAVTPTRRDMTTNLVTTSLDWVPVSEYNTRSNYNHSRKSTNNSDHELTELDNSVSFESGFGRFVPVRPQPRALPLNVQSRENVSHEQNDDAAGNSISSHSLHPYGHQMQNGIIPHSNHPAAAVMIVNPTTPNATGTVSQPFNAPNQNRNNLTRNLNSSRNNFDATHSSNNNIGPTASTSRTGAKTVNLINNMYEQGQSSLNNLNENNQVHRESTRALGEAIVASCPDAAAVERRLGQIREYIRVTSSLVDTMRNSEDEAFIEHTKEEYDELVEMVMKLRESEEKLETILKEKRPENIEVPAEEISEPSVIVQASNVSQENVSESTSVNQNSEKNCNIKLNTENSVTNVNLKKVTNIENEQLNKSMQSVKTADEVSPQEIKVTDLINIENIPETTPPSVEIVEVTDENVTTDDSKTNLKHTEIKKDDDQLNDILRKNILSCVQKVALIEEMKNNKESCKHDDQVSDVMTRPVSAQSNGSTFSDNELWQNEIKNKMEMSQMRLTALKQQQKRLLKYQEEAKQQMDEMNRERQQEIQPSTSHDNFVVQNQPFGGNYHHANRMYAANQIGVATTLPHSTEGVHGHQNMVNGDTDHRHSVHSIHSQDERFSHRGTNVASSEEAAGGLQSEGDDDEIVLTERGRMLQIKLTELQLKKQHMESLVTEFQKLQMATRMPPALNTYSSSGEESAEDEPVRKCVKSGNNNKNEDPFKLMEIKAIKTALQKTKDLMRSVENYETDHTPASHEAAYREVAGHSNINDNKSEGGGSIGGWSNEGSMCRLRNTIPQRHKFTNEQQHPTQHQHLQQQSHEANLASLQELAQELRMETEKIMGERARIKDMISNKTEVRKQKKVNEEVRAGPSGAPGPVERRQMQLRALLAEKQRELEALLNKEKVLCTGAESQQPKPESRTASVVNQSYNSEQDEPDSRSEQILEMQNSRDTENFRGGGDSVLDARSLPTLPSHLGSTYGSDSDTASRNKSNQRNRPRRRLTQERQTDESASQSNNTSQSIRHEPRPEPSNVNMVPPITQNPEHSGSMPYPHLPPPCWNTTKSNQDVRSNQFTQNSHSQTMERLLGTPQMTFPPTMPFNMMMPYGMVGGCGCGCGVWGTWCWQQLVLQQRDIHQLREQITHLEERWRSETASHTLNNQVPPGNRANNYWDNFRSYSRQNLLSANNKVNADGHLGAGVPHNPHPLVERSHNTLRRTPSASSPCVTPKRNTNTTSSTQNVSQTPQPTNEEFPNRTTRRNMSYERSLSFSSAPDVLNVNQNADSEVTVASHSRNVDGASHSRNVDESNSVNIPNVNINRQESAPTTSFRNLNITNPIPEIIQSHSNNLNSSTNSKRKSSSKLPAKNSSNRKNSPLDYSQTSNINIASLSQTPNPNLASTSRENEEKATSKLFDPLRENIYSEVTTLIGVNESHPDFLIQLFRELQLISSENVRQKVLQSIRNVLSQYNTMPENQIGEESQESPISESVTAATEQTNYNDSLSAVSLPNMSTNSIPIDNTIIRFLIMKSDELCTTDFLDTLASHIINTSPDLRYLQHAKRRLQEFLSKYERMRVSDVSNDIIENLPLYIAASVETTPRSNEHLDSTRTQDVAGSLNLFSSSDSQLHQLNACPYEMWPGHLHIDMESDMNEGAHPNQDNKVDLINCTEMHNGDLAEADQTCHVDMDESGTGEGEEAAANAEALPDVVDTDEVTPTEAEAEWLGLDCVPTRLHMEETPSRKRLL